MEVHYSSKSNEWTTPLEFFANLCCRFQLTTDLACTTENKRTQFGLCRDLIDPLTGQQVDSLKVNWATLNKNNGGWLWCNPPYGRDIGKWIKKAYEESLKGTKIIMLIPARTDTSYWHDYIFGKAEIEFIRGRLKFGESKNSAPFPSALIIYGAP